MPRRAKTPRFKEYESFANTYDNFSGQVDFEGSEPEVIELGCGRGEFVLELAKRHPKTRFAGVDIKSDRMWFGARQAKEQKIDNLVYIRADAKDIAEIFEPGSLKGIWLTFPDPYPKKRRAKHRLTHDRFMGLYLKSLVEDGWLRLKTDNDGLFEWTMEELSSTKNWQIAASGRDLHADMPEDSDWRIKTQYEKKFMEAGQEINYLELRKK